MVGYQQQEAAFESRLREMFPRVTAHRLRYETN